MYYTYMIRCKDNSLYTGMTDNVNKRFEKHSSGKGAKYTKSHQVERVEIAWRSKTKSLACKLEYHLKELTKKQKEEIINGEKLNTFLKGKIDKKRKKKMPIEK